MPFPGKHEHRRADIRRSGDRTGSPRLVGKACVVNLALIPETVIDERELWTLAVNRNQDLLGKAMVVLRRPCIAVDEVRFDEWMALRRELRRLVPALRSLFAPDQFNFAFLMNLDAQVHLHVIPRYAGSRQWHGREFKDPHWGSAFGHEQCLLDADELAVLAAAIREALLRVA